MGNLLTALIGATTGMMGDLTSVAPEWGGFVPKSVALQNHRCNEQKRHQGEQECARRRLQGQYIFPFCL